MALLEWTTLETRGSYTLQKQSLTVLCRIIDSDGKTLARGEEGPMRAKLLELTDEGGARFGDVICVPRREPVPLPGLAGLFAPLIPGYNHYGVFESPERVYECTAAENGVNRDIHVTTLERFLNGAERYFVAAFPEVYGAPGKRAVSAPFSGVVGPPVEEQLREMLEKAQRAKEYHLYSPAETVERARSQVGKQGRYDLLFANSEHFAVWCKTGIRESRQAEALIKGYRNFWRRIVLT